MMLESRLILYVTVLASEPLDDLSNGHALEHRMRSPKAMTSPPARYDGAPSFMRLLTPEDNFVLVTSFDVDAICSLGGFSHDDVFLLQFRTSTVVSASRYMPPDNVKYIRSKMFVQSAESTGQQSGNAPSPLQENNPPVRLLSPSASRLVASFT